MRPVRPSALPAAMRLAARGRAAARCWLAWVAVLSTCAANAAQAAGLPPGCSLLWRVEARLDHQPRDLLLEMIFDAGGRAETTLRLPAGWQDLTETDDASGAAAAQRLLPVVGAPSLRHLSHAPDEQVHLRWQLAPARGAASGGVRLAEHWLAFSGEAVLPVPLQADGGDPPEACIELAGLASGQPWLSSLGAPADGDGLLRLHAGTVPLTVGIQQALFAGGALRVPGTDASAPGLTVAMPEDSPWRFDIGALHQAVARSFDAQRRYWGDPPDDRALPWLVLLMPASAGSARAGGTAWFRALALQAPTDMALPGATFDLSMSRALSRAWTAERFGPLAQAGRGDQALRAWFAEGFADFMSHRAMLRQGLWTPTDYAAVLNRKIRGYLLAGEGGAAATVDPMAWAAAQGEWLALRWHAALRAAGRPGLEALLQRLLVPASQAQREGPISQPLATHRLLAALRPALGDMALADLQRHVDQGESFEFGADTLGPCFVGSRQSVGRWQLGFDPDSLEAGQLRGVEPGGPAEAAGLRNGMVLRSHAMTAGDPSQPVRLVVQDDDGRPVERSYLPAGEPKRELPRYDSLPNALQRSDCKAWLGSAVQAAAADPAPRGAGKAARTSKGKPPPGAKAKSKSGAAAKPKTSGSKPPA